MRKATGDPGAHQQDLRRWRHYLGFYQPPETSFRLTPNDQPSPSFVSDGNFVFHRFDNDHLQSRPN